MIKQQFVYNNEWLWLHTTVLKVLLNVQDQWMFDNSYMLW